MKRSACGTDQRVLGTCLVGAGSVVAVLALICAPLLAQVTVKQGERDPNEFHDSMILELPFIPADPNLQKVTDWYSNADYVSLRKYQCDRIRITNVLFRVKGAPKNGQMTVELRFYLQSPDQNHDKKVDLTLEVHNGDAGAATVKRSIKVEEGDNLQKDIELLVPLSGLRTDPMTQLRITVHTKDV